MGFSVLGAVRDGQPEAALTRPRANGVRVYLGHEDAPLAPGPHRYELTYETTDQLGFSPTTMNCTGT